MGNDVSADHSAKLLHRLGEFVRTRPAGLAAEDADAVGDGIDRYFRDKCTLDEAMGVRLDPGENHPGTSLAIAKRDAALRAAAMHLGGTSTENAKKLADMFARYEAGPWQRERTLDLCPRPGRIEGHFWAALKAYTRAIGQRQIQKILATQQEVKSAFDFRTADGRSNPERPK